MQIHIFTSTTKAGLYAFTLSITGNGLPVENGPWSYFKTIVHDGGCRPRIALDAAKMQDDIKRQGYHLTAAGFRRKNSR